ncbi:MAG TPA: hypothetical protein VNJ06_01415 [Gemmatimonadales bacterium]|nr:hypothetical protein [Gemmatimonadales bacterium]
MKTVVGLLTLALALTSCRSDATSAPPDAGAPASLQAQLASDAPRFSEWSAPVNLGALVNSEVEDMAPAISKDGLSLYFASLRAGGAGGFDIWAARRPTSDAAFGAPQSVGPAINTAGGENQPELSIDGHRLFFNSGAAGGFGQADIYMSRRHDQRDDAGWEAPVNLGGGVNSAARETGADYYEDDATGAAMLNFASNRAGGVGGTDIYVSTRLADGTWGAAALVPELSSPFEDTAPCIRRDGLEIVFTSDRTGTLGQTDIWVATRAHTSDPWSTPVNLGAPVNSEFSDGDPSLSFDGTALYFHSAHREGTVGSEGRFDLWVSTRTRLGGPDSER